MRKAIPFVHHFIREDIAFVFVYLTLTYINVRLKLVQTPVWFNGWLERSHELLLQFHYVNNQQSRVLQFLIPEFFHRFLGISVNEAYQLQRFIFFFLTFNIFHFYLRQWFDRRIAFAGVCLAASIIPVIYYADDLQESCNLLMVTFLLILWAINRKSDRWFSIALLVGALNNETVLALSVVYYFANLKNYTIKSLFSVACRTLLLCAPAIIYTCVIRYINRYIPHPPGVWLFFPNLAGMEHDLFSTSDSVFLKNYILFILMFGVLWVYAILDFKKRNSFIQATIIVVPFLVIPHLITGVITEARQMVPLLFILIPASFFWMFKKELIASTHSAALMKEPKEPKKMKKAAPPHQENSTRS